MYRSLPLVAKALLDTIAGGEGTGSRYDVLFGGGHFDSYADHPRQSQQFKGAPTAPAGRYQLQPGTWDDEVKKLKLGDFSPDNQDIAAWDYAKHRYAIYSGNRGLSLQAALESNDPDVLEGVVTALQSTWASLPGAAQQKKGNTQSQFDSDFAGNAAKWAGQANGDDPYAANKAATPSGLPDPINQATGGMFPYEGILPAPSNGDVTVPLSSVSPSEPRLRRPRRSPA